MAKIERTLILKKSIAVGFNVILVTETAPERDLIQNKLDATASRPAKMQGRLM